MSWFGFETAWDKKLRAWPPCCGGIKDFARKVGWRFRVRVIDTMSRRLSTTGFANVLTPAANPLPRSPSSRVSRRKETYPSSFLLLPLLLLFSIDSFEERWEERKEGKKERWITTCSSLLRKILKKCIYIIF